MKTPNPKHQTPAAAALERFGAPREKRQVPSSSARSYPLVFGVWCLVFGVCLSGCRHVQPAYAQVGLTQPPAAGQPGLSKAPRAGPEPALAQPGQPTLTPVTLTNQINPEWLQPSPNLFTLGPGDRVEVEVMGEPGSRITTIVAPDGKIYFNLLPGVDVWGLTLAEARLRMEHEMANYVRNPQISLTLRAVESKRVWVLGRVSAPGVYALAQPMTLLEMVAMAGGTMSLSSFRDQEAAGVGEELADLPHSFVIRHGRMLPVDFQRLVVQGDLSQNIYLEPDDFIYLPAAAARQVYVLGAVGQPRAVPYRPGLTVAGAIAGAYGTLPYAYLHHVAVVRGSLGQPQIAIVDYKRVIRGEALDMALQPRDIVYVPLSPYRYLYRYAELILQTFASSAAINAGTQAVGGTAGPGAAGIFIPAGSGIRVVPPVAPPPP